MSSYHDTDSSNDSFESDSSCRVNAHNTQSIMNDHEKWIEQLTNINSWKTKDDKTLWSETRDKHWKILPNSKERSTNWPVSESGGESFLNSLIRTPIMQRNFPPPPPKPDSPPEVLFKSTLIFILIYGPIKIINLSFSFVGYRVQGRTLEIIAVDVSGEIYVSTRWTFHECAGFSIRHI